MSKFGESQSIKRLEDVRFLTGEGRYVDDVAPRDAWHVVFLRSPVAHAEITGLDLAAAREMPGVKLVLGAGDLAAAGITTGMQFSTLKNRDGETSAAPTRPYLATDRVRYVGEPVAAVICETIEQGRDAVEAIVFDYEELPPHLELAPGGEALHEEVPDNLGYDWASGDEAATEAAFAAAAHRVTLRVEDNRIIVNSMEPRGAYADWQEGRLHVAFGGQGVWNLKPQLAQAFGLKKEDVRVTNPDVGGGFGMKAGPYPEYFVLAHAARALGHPVRWFADRTESMLSDNAGRDLVSTAELAFDADLKITAYRVNILSNLGAYSSNYGQLIQSQISARVLTGVYDVQTYFVNAKGIYTNTTQTDAYRGAGRPEAIFTLERVMDQAARELGVDPFELRRKSFIKPDAFPYQSAVGELYDVGDFSRVLGRLEAEADVPGFAARKAESAGKGLLRGMGLCYYIEAILGDPTEGTTVEFNEDGTVSLYVGTQSNGQGHETVYRQFLSDRTGIPVEKIVVVQGDSDLIASGGGTGGSRSVTTQANSALVTVEKMIAAFTPFLAEELGAAPDFAEGAFRAAGSNRTLTLIEAADLARAKGRTELLKHYKRSTLPGRSYPNGAHLAEVEVDPETGKVTLASYVVTDDFGNLMHPMLAEGQVHGGVAQGIGQAVMEHVGYDDSGQILTATFMDYAMPRATDLPMIRFTSEPVPSTANPLGMKGCGEAGTVGALAAVANAVVDALWDRGVRTAEMPFTPSRVWGWLNEGVEGAAS